MRFSLFSNPEISNWIIYHPEEKLLHVYLSEQQKLSGFQYVDIWHPVVFENLVSINDPLVDILNQHFLLCPDGKVFFFNKNFAEQPKQLDEMIITLAKHGDLFIRTSSYI